MEVAAAALESSEENRISDDYTDQVRQRREEEE